MNSQIQPAQRETEVNVPSGWLMLPLLLILFFGDIGFFLYSVAPQHGQPRWPLLVTTIVAFPILTLMLTGFFTLQPNEARVLILFGAYKGTVRRSGFHWANPFYTNGPRQPIVVQVGDIRTK